MIRLTIRIRSLVPPSSTRRIVRGAGPSPTLHRHRYGIQVLVHSVFGVGIGVPEPVSDRDTRDRDNECKEEDRHEGVKDVVHSVVLVFSCSCLLFT